jgi:hypothetical protein
VKEFGFKFPEIRHQPKSHSMACEALRGYVCPAGFNSEGYQPFSPAGSSSPQKQILQGLRPRIWRGYSTDLYESQTLRDLIHWGLRIWQICSWDLRPCGVWFKEIFYLEGCNSLRPHMNQICWVSNTANGLKVLQILCKKLRGLACVFKETIIIKYFMYKTSFKYLLVVPGQKPRK